MGSMEKEIDHMSYRCTMIRYFMHKEIKAVDIIETEWTELPIHDQHINRTTEEDKHK